MANPTVRQSVPMSEEALDINRGGGGGVRVLAPCLLDVTCGALAKGESK